jgi:proteasome assembly chaperone (PAC2) family protein
LESLQRKDLIKLVIETKKQLEVAKQEAEESAKETRELAKRLEEQQQQQQNGLVKDGDGHGCVGSGDSLVQVFGHLFRLCAANN